jgi:hypothetical protein
MSKMLSNVAEKRYMPDRPLQAMAMDKQNTEDD